MTSTLFRIARFLFVGVLTTGLSYACFVSLTGLRLHYLLASAAGWAASVSLSYVLNKRFTFGLRTPASLRELAEFLAGYVVQLLMGSIVYVILIGALKAQPAPAFLINLVATSTLSFAFMQWRVFRPRPGLDAPPGMQRRSPTRAAPRPSRSASRPAG